MTCYKLDGRHVARPCRRAHTPVIHNASHAAVKKELHGFLIHPYSIGMGLCLVALQAAGAPLKIGSMLYCNFTIPRKIILASLQNCLEYLWCYISLDIFIQYYLGTTFSGLEDVNNHQRAIKKQILEAQNLMLMTTLPLKKFIFRKAVLDTF